ncbi:hypothetical protein JCM11491_002562 [Sporobolomyces phaffii]
MSGLDALFDFNSTAPTQTLADAVLRGFSTIRQQYSAKIIQTRITNIEKLLGPVVNGFRRQTQERLYDAFQTATRQIAQVVAHSIEQVSPYTIWDLLPTELQVFEIVILTEDGISDWTSALPRALFDQVLSGTRANTPCKKDYRQLGSDLRNNALYRNWDQLSSEKQFRIVVELLRFQYDLRLFTPHERSVAEAGLYRFQPRAHTVFPSSVSNAGDPGRHQRKLAVRAQNSTPVSPVHIPRARTGPAAQVLQLPLQRPLPGYNATHPPLPVSQGNAAGPGSLPPVHGTYPSSIIMSSNPAGFHNYQPGYPHVYPSGGQNVASVLRSHNGTPFRPSGSQ